MIYYCAPVFANARRPRRSDLPNLKKPAAPALAPSR